jgi:hypothetical protein
MILDARRVMLLEQIANQWRGHWGDIDGRTGRQWVRTALHGTESELDELRKDLEEDQSHYE